ncbi:MAG: hypothetical protein ACRED3_20195, partial [Bradyrhizobium sp.]
MKLLILAGKLALAASLASVAADIVPVFAADLPAASYKAPVVVEPDSGWTFQATAYVWATSLTGDVGVRGMDPVHIDVSAIDVLKNLDGALMGSFMAKNGDWTILTDLIVAQLSDGIDIGPNGGHLELTQTQVTASGIVGYRLPLGLPENVDLSGTVGFRYQHLKAKADFSGPILQLDAEGTQDWIDPTVGMILNYKINDKWFVNVIGDVGGFGVSSKFTAQGFASLGYM